MAIAIKGGEESGIRDARILNRNSQFSYTCNHCGECCRNRRVFLNPYDTAVLAQELTLSVRQFAEQFIDNRHWSLRNTGNGCALLHNSECSVYAARPTACRLYPLAWRQNQQGEEQFAALTPEPASTGLYGIAGTIDDYLRHTILTEQLSLSARYSRFFQKLECAIDRIDGRDSPQIQELILGRAPLHERLLPKIQKHFSLFLLFDINELLLPHCSAFNIHVPTSLEERANLHLQALDVWLGSI